MIKLTRCSPNTIGAYYTEEYDTYPEEYIEKLCERLANEGWKLSEIKGSTTKEGAIECTHEDRADIELIQWETIEACVMATDKPNLSRTGCAAEGDVFERATMASVVGRDMNSDCKLFRGDCLDVLKEVESGSVDMVLADLPYGTTACKWDTCIPFEPLWEQLHRVCKPNAAMCMFGSEPFSSKLRMSNLKRFKYDWIWNKKKHGNPLNAKRRPLNSLEIISVFYKSQSNYFPIMTAREKIKKSGNVKSIKGEQYFGPIDGKSRTYTQRYPNSLIEFSNANQRGRVHPTQKPVALLEYLIKTYTNEGDTVLDPTMGSGSAGVACKNLGRKFIGIEMDAGYFDIAKRRIDSCNLQAEFK